MAIEDLIGSGFFPELDQEFEGIDEQIAARESLLRGGGGGGRGERPILGQQSFNNTGGHFSTEFDPAASVDPGQQLVDRVIQATTKRARGRAPRITIDGITFDFIGGQARARGRKQDISTNFELNVGTNADVGGFGADGAHVIRQSEPDVSEDLQARAQKALEAQAGEEDDLRSALEVAALTGGPDALSKAFKDFNTQRGKQKQFETLRKLKEQETAEKAEQTKQTNIQKRVDGLETQAVKMLQTRLDSIAKMEANGLQPRSGTWDDMRERARASIFENLDKAQAMAREGKQVGQMFLLRGDGETESFGLPGDTGSGAQRTGQVASQTSRAISDPGVRTAAGLTGDRPANEDLETEAEDAALSLVAGRKFKRQELATIRNALKKGRVTDFTIDQLLGTKVPRVENAPDGDLADFISASGLPHDVVVQIQSVAKTVMRNVDEDAAHGFVRETFQRLASELTKGGFKKSRALSPARPSPSDAKFRGGPVPTAATDPADLISDEGFGEFAQSGQAELAAANDPRDAVAQGAPTPQSQAAEQEFLQSTARDALQGGAAPPQRFNSSPGGILEPVGGQGGSLKTNNLAPDAINEILRVLTEGSPEEKRASLAFADPRIAGFRDLTRGMGEREKIDMMIRILSSQQR